MKEREIAANRPSETSLHACKETFHAQVLLGPVCRQNPSKSADNPNKKGCFSVGIQIAPEPFGA
jgi:hypothetical protein